MELDFLHYCNQKLNPPEFVIYFILRQIGPCIVSQQEITDLAGKTSKSHVSPILRKLQRKGFIAYQSLHSTGTDIYWIRMEASDKFPSYDSPLKTQYRWVLVHKERKLTEVIKPGGFMAFSKKYGLRSCTVSELIRGYRDEYRGWIVWEGKVRGSKKLKDFLENDQTA
jgi:hypothetical protein